MIYQSISELSRESSLIRSSRKNNIGPWTLDYTIDERKRNPPINKRGRVPNRMNYGQRLSTEIDRELK